MAVFFLHFSSLILCSVLALFLLAMFCQVRAAPAAYQMDRNAFRMSFGKRSQPMETESSELNGANIAIPLLYDMAGAETAAQKQRHRVSAPWATRWKVSLFSKRLDRNLYNIGFGRRRR
ncbi:hypothetical protein niasHT_007141 [Heterodera trifolii]|uniref:Uncharacterized protein n=1 Tax=Heterodera trifolii TaxID=157864 RepID=A0ABD2LL69_9BILA